MVVQRQLAEGVCLTMLVSKIWTVAVAIDVPEFSQFTYTPVLIQFTLIIITSYYFHNVTAYEYSLSIKSVDKEHDLCQLIPGPSRLTAILRAG